MITRNILANLLGGSWFVLLSLMIIPIQIKKLGIEVYGVLAFIASLQVMLSVLDFGISPTVTRQVAGDTSPQLRKSRDLVQTLFAGYWFLGLLVGSIVAVSAHLIATQWLELKEFSPIRAELAIQLSAIAFILRWPISFCSGIIAGRQRFELLNSLKVGISTVSLVGGALILVASSSLTAFLGWLVFAAFLELVAYVIACFRLLPGLSLWPRFAYKDMRNVFSFALGVATINTLAIALTQTDRLLISKLLPTATMGYYSLAYNVLYGLTLLQTSITSVVFPALSENHAGGDLEVFARRYDGATQGLVFAYALPISVLLFAGQDVLRIWAGAEVAGKSAPILAILSIGFLLNAVVSIPYIACLATGKTGIPVIVNLVGLFVYLPILYLAIVRWEMMGAAFVWVALNLYYIFFLIPLVHSRVISRNTFTWLRRNVVPFLAYALISFYCGQALIAKRGWQSGWGSAAISTLSVIAYLCLSFLSMDSALKSEVGKHLKHLGSLFRPQPAMSKRDIA